MTLLSSHATLIYNPYAGFWDWSAVVAQVVTFWERQGWTMTVRSTAYTNHATALAREAVAAGHGLVLAAGGDGTLNEVANGLVHTETVLAPLPVGTANSFAKELGLPRPNLLNQSWLLEVSRSLALGRVQRMDVGQSDNGRYWLLWASTGWDGFVVRQIEPRPRWFKRLGVAGYLTKVLYYLPRFTGLHAAITVDDQVFRGDYLLVNVSNCRMWAGGELRLNRQAVLDDGLFEVWLFRGRNWPTIFAYTFDISRDQHHRNPQVKVLRARYVAVHTDPAAHYHMDGEPAADTPFACRVVPRALRLLVPESAPADLFSSPGERLAH
jgi:YegS/Rv2252/BmrU family lipid kinase